MKTLRIHSTHATLAEAVKASGIDLEYNEPEAQRKIKDADTACPRAHQMGIRATEQAWVLDDEGERFAAYAYTANGIRMVRKFEPFMSVLSNADLVFWELTSTAFVETTFAFRNNASGRVAISELCKATTNYFIGSF